MLRPEEESRRMEETDMNLNNKKLTLFFIVLSVYLTALAILLTVSTILGHEAYQHMDIYARMTHKKCVVMIDTKAGIMGVYQDGERIYSMKDKRLKTAPRGDMTAHFSDLSVEFWNSDAEDESSYVVLLKKKRSLKRLDGLPDEVDAVIF